MSRTSPPIRVPKQVQWTSTWAGWVSPLKNIKAQLYDKWSKGRRKGQILYTDLVGVYGAPHTPGVPFGPAHIRRSTASSSAYCFFGIVPSCAAPRVPVLRLRVRHFFARVPPSTSASATSSLKYWFSSSPPMAAKGQYRSLCLLVRELLDSF
jgi:hypothetical protein